MPGEYNPKDNHDNYVETIFYRRLLRDSVKGPAAIKNAGELYLPMPSGWRSLDVPTEKSQMEFNPMNNKSKVHNQMLSSYLPWSHSNPIYRAYLQRAKYPDLVANTLRLMLGISTKNPAKLELPERLDYLENTVTPQQENLDQLFAYCIMEVCTASKICLVVDTDLNTSQLKISTYVAESNINWDYGIVNGAEVITSCSFNDLWEDESGEQHDVVKEFYLDENGNPWYAIFKDDDDDPSHKEPLLYKGKPFSRIPVFPIGSMKNHLENQNIPLSGIADIAITLYQMSADLRQAQFMTCNPTLFLYGATEREKPQVLGTQVVVSLKNPAARAEYPRTDTSAFEHIRQDMKDLFQEAVTYGASLITSGAGESGDALSLRKADNGASLVHIVNLVGDGILSAMEFIGEMNSVLEEIIYEPSTDFADVNLTSNDITALVNAWLSGALDLDSLLDNFRAANFVSDEKTNDEIKQSIQDEAPRVSAPDEENDSGEEDKDADEEEKEPGDE